MSFSNRMYQYPARFKSQVLSEASLRPGPFCWRAAAAWSPRRTSTQWLSSALLSVGKRRWKAWCTRWSRPLQHDQIRQTRICSPCPLPVVPSTMFSFIPCGNHLHFANLLWISMVYDCHKHTSQWTSLLCCYPVATLSRWNEWSISWNLIHFIHTVGILESFDWQVLSVGSKTWPRWCGIEQLPGTVRHSLFEASDSGEDTGEDGLQKAENKLNKWQLLVNDFRNDYQILCNFECIMECHRLKSTWLSICISLRLRLTQLWSHFLD